MVWSACERRCQNSCIGAPFLEGRLATEHSSSDPRLPTWFFTHCSARRKEQRERRGICSNCHSRQLSLFVEKRVTVSVHTTAPYASGAIHFSFEGQAKLHSEIHGLPHIHSGKNAHKLEFGITILTSKPIS